MMHPLRKIYCGQLLFALVLLAVVTVSGCVADRSQRLAQGDRAAFDRMVTDVRQSRVILIGEFHDHREHHDLQLQVIKALRHEGLPVAIGLEMFDHESQPTLDRWVAGKIELKDFVDYYQQKWTILWAEYGEIFLYARNNHIPLVGLDAPEEIVTRVAHGGFQSLRGRDLERLPAGVTPRMSESYREFLRAPFRSHRMEETLFDNFCEAQGVRNSTMARVIDGYLAKNAGSTMVVITGMGHAIRRGMAAELEKEFRLRAKIIIPATEDTFDMLEHDDADYFVYL